MSHIRASVDALCRDETDQISRDPHTKSILTWRERLASLRNAPAVAHGFISSCTYAVIPHTYLGVLHMRICSHAISGFSCHHHHYYSSSSSVNPLSPNRNKFLCADFSTEHLYCRRRCDQSPSDHFSFVPRCCSRSWSSSRCTLNDTICCQLSMRGRLGVTHGAHAHAV